MKKMIEARNLKKAYEKHVLFEHVNLEIYQNEMVAIMGKSGTGKTTLLNILGLIEAASTGDILYEGKKINFKKKKQITELLKTKIGFLFQNFALLNEKTIYDNLKLAMPRKMSHSDKKMRMKEALGKVGLRKPLEEKIFYLSGGEQQRVALARLFLKENSVIFADEPTGSLDEENRDVVLGLLQDLKNEGKTIVIVTHDKVVGEYCDRIIYLEPSNK